MADLSSSDKRRLERLFGMGSGYVLDFSNRTFAEFVEESVQRDIYDTRYDHGSGSKANRLRGFWTAEGNHLVAKLIGDLIAYGQESDAFKDDGTLSEECLRIAARLKQSARSPNLTRCAPRSTSGISKLWRDRLARRSRRTSRKPDSTVSIRL